MTADYLTNILQTNLLAILRNEPCLAALVHSTEADVASRVALKAVSGMSDGDVRLVEEITDDAFAFDGLFVYDDDATDVNDDKDVIEPTVGDGAWLRYETISTSLAWGKSEGSGGHVFTGMTTALHGGRNRGRMPFVEMDIDNGSFDDSSTSGGIVEIGVNLRCWYTNNMGDLGTKNARQMALRVARAIRNWWFDASGDVYAPGVQPTVSTRNFADAKIDILDVTRGSGFAYCDMRAEIPLSYTEGTLV